MTRYRAVPAARARWPLNGPSVFQIKTHATAPETSPTTLLLMSSQKTIGPRSATSVPAMAGGNMVGRGTPEGGSKHPVPGRARASWIPGPTRNSKAYLAIAAHRCQRLLASRHQQASLVRGSPRPRLSRLDQKAGMNSGRSDGKMVDIDHRGDSASTPRESIIQDPTT